MIAGLDALWSSTTKSSGGWYFLYARLPSSQDGTLYGRIADFMQVRSHIPSHRTVPGIAVERGEREREREREMSWPSFVPDQAYFYLDRLCARVFRAVMLDGTWKSTQNAMEEAPSLLSSDSDHYSVLCLCKT